jgi:chromate reductase, NAD(P)H dehydrogenase (quinone)
VNVLVVSGSSRRESLNTRLARLVAALRPDDATRVVSDLTRLPFYDADVEAAGTPEPVSELRTAVRAADLLVLVTPEYNGSVPGLLANAIDWLSRPHRDAALRGTSVLVLSPSGGTRPAAPVPPQSSAPC